MQATASTGAHALLRREKPSGSSPVKWIVGGSIVGVVLIVVISLALFFHFRRRRADRAEHQKDLQEMDDYGLADYPQGRQDDVAWPERGQSSLRPGSGGERKEEGEQKQGHVGASLV
ncbi:hypothetical protein LIA77_09857 [Sarocladium implicatum]|nr:hypothetical protein LIA77_09857 [Sarocladium implicatum]